MKITAAIVLLCLGSAYAQAPTVEFSTPNGPIETNSTRLVQCKTVNFKPVVATTLNYTVTLQAILGTDNKAAPTILGTWTQVVNSGTYNSSFVADPAANKVGITIGDAAHSQDLTTFNASLTLKNATSTGSYTCELKATDAAKKETKFISNPVTAEKPLYSAAVVVSGDSKAIVNHPFNVSCFVTSLQDAAAKEKFDVSKVEFFLETTLIATYTIADEKGTKTAKFAPVAGLAQLVATEGIKKGPTDYQIIVNPKAKTATGKYECVVTAQTADAKKERKYISDEKPVDVKSGARWVAPSIAFILFNLALFLHL